jgi:hypothetical protein
VKTPVVDYQQLTKIALKSRHAVAIIFGCSVNVTDFCNSLSPNNFPPNRSTA